MITVLRLEHRPFRDQRITTHCGLVARALGASAFVYSGQQDDKLENSIRGVVGNFGGKFSIQYTESWKTFLKGFKGKKIHLTMYGLPMQKQIQKIRKHRNILLIIGGEKVPFEVYKLADYNISVTSQPHSEVAALAIFLDKYFVGKELEKKFPGAKKKVIPNSRLKQVKTCFQLRGKKVTGK